MTQSKNKLWNDIIGLKRLWPYLRRSKKKLYFSIALIPIISLFQTSMPLLIKWIIDNGVVPKDLDALIYGSVAGLIFIFLEYIVRATQSITIAQSVHVMIRDMRESLIQHILRLSPKFHDRNMSGALVTRATSDFDSLSDALNLGVLNSVVDFAVLIGAIVGLFVLNWKLALCTIVILPFVVLLITQTSKVLKRTMLAARVKIAALNAFTQECFYNSKTIKLLVANRQATKQVAELSEEFRNAQMKSVIIDALLFAFLDGIASITIGVILWFAVSQIFGSTESTVTVGVMVAFVQYIQNLFDPLKQLGNKIAMLQGAFTSLDRIFGVFDVKDFIEGTKALEPGDGSIQVKNLRFGYNSGEEIIKGISFDLQQGKSLALVGRTGSGKSTIIKLLSKMYQGYDGEISFSGQSISEINPTKLRQSLSIVPQDIVLFRGSIRFNITLDNEKISEQAAKEAAALVGLDNLLQSLPGDMEFEVAEDGGNLSQGQKQLIIFARALARNPDIIILDEATSSIDPASERLVQSAIETILRNKTVIVIAHRLSTIQSCDEILYLQNGKVLEKGNHETLIAEKGHYFDLYSAGVNS